MGRSKVIIDGCIKFRRQTFHLLSPSQTNRSFPSFFNVLFPINIIILFLLQISNYNYVRSSMGLKQC